MQAKLTKPIGVLGGMGPRSTQLFYGMVIANTKASRDQDHIDLIILNHASLPDRTWALLSNNTEPLIDLLIADCKFLENSGVSHIVIPCNTAHCFVDKLQAEIKTPIINMIREVVGGIKDTKKDGAKVGILATDGTVRLGIYQKELESAGLVAVLPSEENQSRVMKIIYDGIKKGSEINYSDFEKIEKEMLDAGCEHVIMGCTELSVFMEMYEIEQGFYIDAMKVLALKAIASANKQVK